MELTIVVGLALLLAIGIVTSKKSQPEPKSSHKVNLYGTHTLSHNSKKYQWVFGWKDAEQQNDAIYLRVSDHGSWSNLKTVITPAQIQNAHHVGDPSVTVHTNLMDNSTQFTMFFTVCLGNCEERLSKNDNRIYSAVSNDGYSWSNFQELSLGELGAAEPSAVFFGSGWHVYYCDRLDPSKIKKALVSGNRQVMDIETVFEDKQVLGALTGVDVQEDRMLVNIHIGSGENYRVDVYEVEGDKLSPVIENSTKDGEYCVASTPDLHGNDLWISRAKRLNGVCQNTQHEKIESVNV